MGWVGGARLVSATAAAGGLGVIASATMNLAQLRKAIDQVLASTDRPFGVNVMPTASDLDARLALMAEKGVKVASFPQAPTAKTVQRCHDGSMWVLSTIGARRHAEKVIDLGVDGVIAQGGEGGGHTGSVPTTLLVPQVVDAVGDHLVVLAAGGIFDGRGLVAALSYGAQGVAMGTRFLLSAESTVPDIVKSRYLAASVMDTVVSAKIDGAPQRVIRTDFIDQLERSPWWRLLPRALASAHAFRKETEMSLFDLAREGWAMLKSKEVNLTRLVLAANAPVMTKAALIDGRTDVGILPTGQVVGLIEKIPTVAEIVSGMIEQANAVLDRLGGGAAPPG
jgi:NAD(P)H-dependent flavin oxidoreductase YrpB (nitropropane dioxygenase family)